MSHLISTAPPAARAVAGSTRGKYSSSSRQEAADSHRISDVPFQARVTGLPEVAPSLSQSLQTPTSQFRNPDPSPPQAAGLVDTMPSHMRRSLVDSCFILGRPGPLKNPNSTLRSVAVSPDWKQVASGSDDGIIRLWDGETNRSRQLKEQTGSSVKCVAFSPNGKRIVVGSFDQNLRIWNLRTEDCQLFIGHSGSIDSVAFAPDGKRIISGSFDDTIRVWDAETGNSQQLLGHTGNVAAVTFSSDSKQIASGSWDRTIRIWDIATGVSRLLSGHTPWVRVVAWSPDGRYFASGSEDSTICVWDVKTGSSRTFSGHTHWVQALAFSPDGKYIASGSRDCTVRVFDTKTGRLILGPLKGHNRVRCVTFSRDGRHLLSACNGGLLRVWNM
jgi:WD40 repeat protein